MTSHGFLILEKICGYFCGYIGLSWIFYGLSDFVDIHVVDIGCLWISTVQLHAPSLTLVVLLVSKQLQAVDTRRSAVALIAI